MNLHTKEDFIRLCGEILNPIKKFYSDKCAYMNCGTHGTWYENVSAAVEGFARPLWGLVPLWAGGNDLEDFKDIYIEGITAGVDPDSGEYWGECQKGDQRFVEMAAMAYGMLFAPEHIWEPLSDKAKDGFVRWLSSINEHEIWESNWLFFRILVNVALKKVGREYRQDLLDKDFNCIEKFYLGDGWYKDGHNENKDYYIAFAIHFYSLVYAIAMEKDDPERSVLFKKRAEEFGKQFIYWFAENGAAMPYGRSMTYRFAQVSFWSACLMAGVYPFEIGVIKGIIVRHLKDWFENGKIFDAGGVLTVGYKYGNLIMSEHYNAPGSPYWGMKAFAVLMLGDDHPFWSAPALPLPKLDGIKVMKFADMIVQRRGGEVFAFPLGRTNMSHTTGLGHTTEKYMKFSYSTLFGFNVAFSSVAMDEAAPDSMLAFEVDGVVLTRRDNFAFNIDGQTTNAKWSPFRGITVETTVVPTAEGHERIHEIESDIECVAYDCGYAVPNGDNDGFCFAQQKGVCTAENNRVYCSVSIEELNGCDGLDGKLVNASPNTNLLYSKTAIPAVGIAIPKGKCRIKTIIKAGGK